MKLHSDKISTQDIREALETARAKGKIVGDTELLVLEEQGSRKRENGWEVRLGVKHRDGVHNRRNMNNTAYSATWEEWGWFIVELFELDIDLEFGSYTSYNEFHTQTRYNFA